ncbi:glycosyltransferase family 39 protein [Ramlibacter tataouinensis]|uniref:ArnT family glycosyltransferase n=1 Tax=Ramlibacter tataouinensis TaxID=94132 RepID=UPI0022F3DB8A|nr:glycosyltransferase family 39 protein [Ramlibacter tataouinensis]WBY02592.1 glycosyltransferase family 39 protein [Ramlibacter tataouinensis]
MRGQPGPAAREAIGVALVLVAWLGATAWMRPLQLPDEGRYVGVAWEMLRSGDWAVPTLNGLPYFHKPPLFYWITAASLSVFGNSEWAARAAPLLGGWLAAFSMYLFVRRWQGLRVARLTVLALALQPMLYAGAQFANLDMLVAGCITVAITCLAHAALGFEQDRPVPEFVALAWLFAGLGVLAKGLIGVVIPALVVGVWLVVRGRWRTLRHLLWWPGVVLFLGIAAPWFLAMQQRFPEFLQYFFVVQHFERYAAGGFNNVQPPWFFPAVLALFSIPWLPWLYRSARQLLARRSQALANPVTLLAGLWVVLVILFFSLPASKLPGYVLPAVPPLAYLAASAFAGLQRPSVAQRMAWQASCWMAAAVCFGAVAYVGHSPRTSRELGSALRLHREPGEPVLMLNRYAYDVPFYAGLRQPVAVVEAWDSPEVRQQDDWKRELADAGRFDRGRAAGLLLTPDAAMQHLCTVPAAWVVADEQAHERYRLLAQGRLVARQRGVALWRVEPARGLPEGGACRAAPAD